MDQIIQASHCAGVDDVLPKVRLGTQPTDRKMEEDNNAFATS